MARLFSPTTSSQAGTTHAEMRRDAWLRLSDLALIRECREERYRSSGPGGQHRNKVETAVRLHHAPTGLSAHGDESRSLQDNRLKAAQRIREKMALELREPFDLASPALPPEFLAQRGPKGTLAANPHNPAYPIIVATVLDALAAAEGSYAGAAHPLGLTTSQLLRFLRADSHIWREISRARDETRERRTGPVVQDSKGQIQDS